MPTLRISTVSVCVAGLMVAAPAQTLETLLGNDHQLQVNLTLDRSTYFPREAAVISIVIKNPTARQLQVVAPFWTECFSLFVPNSDGARNPLGSGDGCTTWPGTSTPQTTIFGAGERRNFIMNSYDSTFANGLYPMDGPTAPLDPGSYALGYSYNEVSAPFSVVQPLLDMAAIVRVQDVLNKDPAPSDDRTIPQYVHVFSLRWNNQSYLCVGRPQSNQQPVGLRADGSLVLPAMYKRIATSANPIVSITPTADTAGNLSITWVDSAGTKTVTPYPANGGDTVAPVIISYRVYFGKQAFELNTSARSRLPWQITGIEAAFSKPVAKANLNSIGGVTATEVLGLNTNTLLWMINPLSSGNVSTTLVNSGTNAITDAVGNALGGGSTFSFKILVGDVNDDGVVDSNDLAIINSAVGGPYNIFADLNGDGVVNGKDVALLTAILNPPQ